MLTKRTFLVISVVTCCGIGAAFISVPFISSLSPNMSAASAITKIVSTNELSPGDFKIVTWLNDPIIFYKATESEIYSYIGTSTYRGCALQFLPEDEERYGTKWNGGWVDPCHIGAWDVQGKFLVGANSGSDTILPNLTEIEGLSWEGTNAILRVSNEAN